MRALNNKNTNNGSFCVAFSVLFLLTFSSPVFADLTCSGVTSILGIEYVAECVEGGPPYRYVQTDIRCESGQVVKGPVQQWMNGGITMTPAYVESVVVSSASFSSGVVFGNSDQTHYIVVTNTFAKYGGVLDGNSLRSLSYGTLYVDRLSGIGVIPKDIVDLDADGDNSFVCDDCNDSNPAVNPGALEVCGDGLDNNCDGFSDCADQSCAESPECNVSPERDVDPEDFPRDRCTEK